ncbi:uncharacterized protein LOC133193669 [Saccostrea echinata]|uniref:uncharacterized protein LOC133193669 n=1 Tax=Saccostrea echinata TaxID=191078 RepID=UPI002A800EBF|nr:uncharacterized protein LOC133193669 [Saccostrea echinata]
MDNVTSTSLLHLIQKHPERRTRKEIDLFLPAFMMKTDCLRNVERDVAAEILKYSEHLHVDKGTVIVTQGEEGSKFYVVIRGSVGVYVKEISRKARKKKSMVIELPSIYSTASANSLKKETQSHQSQCHVKDVNIEQLDPMEELYGPKVNVLPTGHSFGELALLGSIVRNATIVAEETVDLLVIDRELFESTISANQSKELDAKRFFVKTHPFFAKWTEAHKEHLVATLKRRVFYPGQCAFRQGSEVKGLHFLVTGKARLSAIPDLHRKQYPALFHAAEMSKKHPLDFEHQNAKYSKLPSIHRNQNKYMTELASIKRTDGYAAAERFVASRKVELCHVEGGDIIHDIEIMLNLPTSLFRVFCSTECEFYTLNTNQIDRLITKRNASVLTLLKTRTETKLAVRIASIPGKKIDILPLLLLQLRFVRIFKEKDSEKHEESASIHRLPLSECLNISGYEYQEYSPNEGVADSVVHKSDVPKYVLEGPDYYRKLMRKRQQEREELRRRYPDQINECKSISNDMKDMILNSVKQRHLVEKIMKRYSLGWTMEGPWVTRWK